MATTASYPGTIVNFGNDKVNTVDLIQAADPNTLRAEVVAIETVLGATPSVSTSAGTTGWNNDGRDYGTLIARLANIEIGVVADTHTQYVKKVGGSTITVATASTVGLAIAGATGQTADLMQWQDSNGNVITRVGSDGILHASGAQIGDYTGIFLLGGM